VKILYTFILHTLTESELISRFRESKKGQVTKFLTVKTNIIHYIWNSDINIWREGAHKLGRKDHIQYFAVSKTVPIFNSHSRPTKCTACLCQLSVKFILAIIHTFTNLWDFRFSQRFCCNIQVFWHVTKCCNTGSFKKIWTSSTLATEVTGPDTLWFFPIGIR